MFQLVFLRRAHGPFALFKARFEKTQDEIVSDCGKSLFTGGQWDPGSVLGVSCAGMAGQLCTPGSANNVYFRSSLDFYFLGLDWFNLSTCAALKL